MTGRLVGAHDVCQAVEAVLAAWLPSALATYAPTLPTPQTFGMPTPEAFVHGDGLPALVVSSPGLSGDPVQHGDGKYDAAWDIVVTVYARGDTYEQAAFTTREYAKTVRAVLLQQQTLDGFADRLDWLAEDYDPIDRSTVRTLGAAYVRVRVIVPDVVDLLDPPALPPSPAAAWGDGPTALSTAVTVHPAL